MTREQAREAAAVMLHYAEGGEVEFFSNVVSDWSQITNPTFDWKEFTYRIKFTLPEVGKWYEIPGMESNPYKCIANDLGFYVFLSPYTSIFYNRCESNFTHFKQVEP